MSALQCQGTIRGNDDFKPDEASQELRKAMKGLGTDELRIIKVLTIHNNEQRQAIKNQYKTQFGRDLIADLKSELSGFFETLCLYLLMPTNCFDAFCMRKAMEGTGTKEVLLIDILASRSNEEIESIKTVYKDLFKRDLETDIVDETSSDFERVLRALLQGRRKDDASVDEEAAKADAKELYDAGEAMRFGTDEDVFTKIMVTRSASHLQKVFECYKQMAEKDIEDSIKSEFSGDTEKVLLAIVQHKKDPLRYFAKCLHDSMAGLGTDDERLMQLMVSHSEVDLKDIAETYEKEYKTPLEKDIHGDTKGDYRKLLLRILDPESHMKQNGGAKKD